jgi:hypothetical protein|tara:strand:- start:415 stop:603 length:189 start_codon:yes stop_codon:yes gene_type:complete
MIKKILLWLLEMNSKNVTGVTGKKAGVSGIYRSEDQYIPISKKETFPPSSDKSVVWKLVVSV